MRNCLYNKNYNMKNGCGCGNMQNNPNHNMNCNNMNTNQGCGNMVNNSNFGNMQNNQCCGKMQQKQGCGTMQNNQGFNCMNNNLNRKSAEAENKTENRQCGNNDLMEEMKLELQATDFTIEDLALYLDTHPDDMRAVCMHNQCAKNYRKLSDEYQKVYGPLNIMYPCNSWRWLEEPWPWQKTNNCSMMQNYRAASEEIENDFDLKGGIN